MGTVAALGPSAALKVRSAIRWALRRVAGEAGLLTTHRRYHAALRRLGRFEPPENPTVLFLLAAVAARCGAILDIGANVGIYSWFFAQRRTGHAPVFAFEPNASAAALLRSTLTNVPAAHVFPFALGGQDATVELTVPRDAFGNAVSGLGWVGAPTGGGAAIPMRRLDSMMDNGELELCAPILMKIDVEGHEPAVLAGCPQLLERFRPAIYFECEPTTLARAGFPPEATFHRLAAHGYIVLTERNGAFVVCTEPIPGHANYIAVPSPAVPPLAGTSVTGNVVASWALGDA